MAPESMFGQAIEAVFCLAPGQQRRVFGVRQSPTPGLSRWGRRNQCVRDPSGTRAYLTHNELDSPVHSYRTRGGTPVADARGSQVTAPSQVQALTKALRNPGS